jgi:SPX domain protein involved in polyphosphate accumulation
MPEWVSKLCNSSLVERVPKFSKYLTGCAMVLEDRVVTGPEWMPKMKKVMRLAGCG